MVDDDGRMDELLDQARPPWLVQAAAALQEGEVSPVRCLGDPCGQTTLVGVDGAGRAIAQESSREPMFGVPLAVTSSWTEPPERMFTIDPARPEEGQTLLRSGNFYDFGAVTANGRFASVETFGHDRTEAVVILNLADGSIHGTILLQPRERTRFQRPAPDGSGVVAWLDDGGCFLLAPGRRTELPPLRNARWVELDDGVQLVGLLDDGTLARFDGAGARLSGGARLGGSLLAAVVSGPDEILLLAREDGACRLERRSATTLARTERLELATCLASPQLLPDGRLVGIAEVTTAGDVPGDPEVVVTAPGQAEPVQLTSGRFVEETVYPTADGTRVYFNRRLEHPPREYDVGLYRRVVCWTDLPE